MVWESSTSHLYFYATNIKIQIYNSGFRSKVHLLAFYWTVSPAIPDSEGESDFSEWVSLMTENSLLIRLLFLFSVRMVWFAMKQLSSYTFGPSELILYLNGCMTWSITHISQSSHWDTSSLTSWSDTMFSPQLPAPSPLRSLLGGIVCWITLSHLPICKLFFLTCSSFSLFLLIYMCRTEHDNPNNFISTILVSM